MEERPRRPASFSKRWRASSTDSESRAYLQTRLEMFSKLMFFSIAALFTFLTIQYAMYPDIRPARQGLISGGAIGGLVVLGVIWRAVLVRRPLSIAALYRIDAFYGIGIGIAFGVDAYLAADLPPAAYACMLYACFTVFTRTIVIPSGARRTAAVSAMTFAPLTVAAIGLGLDGNPGLPGPAFVAAGLLFSAVAVLLATIGSRVIYGLRRQVSEAMQLGQYTLESKVGEGGFGSVWRARHALLRRPTAIKLLIPARIRPETLDRFEREVQHTAQLTHPNTVAVYDYGHNPDGVFYYAMEYLGGGIDLERLVAKHGPQPAGRITQILVQVCGALQEAHEDRKSTRLNSSHSSPSRMPSSA